MQIQYRRSRTSQSRIVTALVVIALILLSCLAYLQFNSVSKFTEGDLNQPTLQGRIDHLQAQLKNVSASLRLATAKQRQEAQSCHLQEASLVQQLANLTTHVSNLTALLEAEEQAKNSLAQQIEQTQPETKPWLVIGIPTVPRKDETDYLTHTLASALDELPLHPSELLYGRVKIVIMNNRPGNHSVYAKVKARVDKETKGDVFAQKAKLYVQFVDNPGDVSDPNPNAPEPDDLNNPKNLPGRQVRQQTCDLISLLRMCQSLSHYYLFMEDDFGVCPNMLRILAYTIEKLNTEVWYGDWLGLRLSYGMNGILLKNKDLDLLIDYLWKNTARLPPDLLWIEYYSSRKRELRVNRGRKLAVYKSNLLEHLGQKSSFAVRVDRPDWPRCFHPMADMWSLAKTEKFNEAKCSHYDLSPCPHADSKSTLWVDHPIIWPNISLGASSSTKSNATVHPGLLAAEIEAMKALYEASWMQD